MWYVSYVLTDEEREDRIFDLMWEIAREENYDWDRHRGLIYEKALRRMNEEEGQK
jgi:hypothetical protein